MSYDFDQQPQNQGMSSGAKIAIGCGAIGALTMLLLCGGVIFFGFRLADKAQEVVEQVVKEMEKKVEAFAVAFEAQGYERVSGQVVDITSDIEQPTVYTVQVFKLNADSNASLAVMAQVAEINGRIDGDLTFFGQSLVIHKNAVVTGNVNVQMAQVVDNRGTVEGEIIEDENLAKQIGMPTGTSGFPDAPIEVEPKPAPGDVIDTTPDEAPADAEAPTDDLAPIKVPDSNP